MLHKGTQSIKTERLTLRRFSTNDAEAMFSNWCNDARVSEYMSWEPHGNIAVTRAILGDWVMAYSNPAYYHWGIEMGGELIGSISAHNVNERIRSCEVGYALSYDKWNMGIMTEALTALLDFLFDEVGFNRVGALHRLENPASGRVMEKCGMQLEGIIRQIVSDDAGNFYDCRQYSIVASDRKQDRS